MAKLAFYTKSIFLIGSIILVTVLGWHLFFSINYELLRLNATETLKCVDTHVAGSMKWTIIISCQVTGWGFIYQICFTMFVAYHQIRYLCAYYRTNILQYLPPSLIKLLICSFNVVFCMSGLISLIAYIIIKNEGNCTNNLAMKLLAATCISFARVVPSVGFYIVWWIYSRDKLESEKSCCLRGREKSAPSFFHWLYESRAEALKRWAEDDVERAEKKKYEHNTIEPTMESATCSNETPWLCCGFEQPANSKNCMECGSSRLQHV